MVKTADLPQRANPLWDAREDYLRVIIKDLTIETRIGLHAWERHEDHPQRIVINIELFKRQPERMTAQAGADVVIDYDYIRRSLRQWRNRQQVTYIEPLLEELVDLCFQDQRVEACRVSIVKPDIYSDAAAAGAELYRVRRPG